MSRTLSYNVCLHPGFVVSKSDGDKHFIGSHKLAYLYGVSKEDNVVIYDPKDWTHQEEWQKAHNIHVIHLYPRYDGKYEDIHKEDDRRIDAIMSEFA